MAWPSLIGGRRFAFALLMAGLCAAAGATGAQGAVPPLPPVNARALYVSCFLMAQGTDVPRPAPDRAYPFSALTCGLYAVHAVGLREGRPDQPGGFCMGKVSEAGRRMASAYVVYHEAHPFVGEPPDGEPRFRAAMQAAWPCPAK